MMVMSLVSSTAAVEVGEPNWITLPLKPVLALFQTSVAPDSSVTVNAESVAAKPPLPLQYTPAVLPISALKTPLLRKIAGSLLADAKFSVPAIMLEAEDSRYPRPTVAPPDAPE